MTSHKIIKTHNYTTLLINPVSIAYGESITCISENFNENFMTQYLFTLELLGKLLKRKLNITHLISVLITT